MTTLPGPFPAEVAFTFSPDDGPAQQIVIPACTAGLYAELVDAAAGRVPGDSVFLIDSCPAGSSEISRLLYRAARISDVQVNP